MTDSTVASNVTGTVGTVCWSIQLIPQIIYNYLRKDCTGLPPLMMFLWAACGIPFSIYFFITQPSIAVQVQPEIFTVLCSISFCQSIYYPPIKMNKLKILAIMCVFYSIAIGSELGFILWLRPVYQHGTTWPSLIFGIMASVMLAAGLVPPYFELAKRKGRVVGINFIFLAIDCSGAIFSMVSLLTGGMDITGMVLYCICITMEIGIFVSHFIWYIRFRVIRKEKDEDENKDEEEIRNNEENDENSIGNGFLERKTQNENENESRSHGDSKEEASIRNYESSDFIDEYQIGEVDEVV